MRCCLLLTPQSVGTGLPPDTRKNSSAHSPWEREMFIMEWILWFIPFRWVQKSQIRPALVLSGRCHCSSCSNMFSSHDLLHDPLTWWPWGDTWAGGWPGWPSMSRSPWCGCCRHTGSGNTPRTLRRRSRRAPRPCQHNPEQGKYIIWQEIRRGMG